MQKSMGIAVDPDYAGYVSEHLEEAGVDYLIWNAEEAFFGNPQKVEFSVETEEELAILRFIVNSARRFFKQKRKADSENC